MKISADWQSFSQIMMEHSGHIIFFFYSNAASYYNTAIFEGRLSVIGICI